MLPKSLTSLLLPRAILIVGLACAVGLVSRNIAKEKSDRQAFAQEQQEYRRQLIAYDLCAEEIKKSDRHGELLDVVIDARCPVKPSHKPIDPLFFARYLRKSRATGFGFAGIVAVLTSLPWLVSRSTQSRVRSPLEEAP